MATLDEIRAKYQGQPAGAVVDSTAPTAPTPSPLDVIRAKYTAPAQATPQPPTPAPSGPTGNPILDFFPNVGREVAETAKNLGQTGIIPPGAGNIEPDSATDIARRGVNLALGPLATITGVGGLRSAVRPFLKPAQQAAQEAAAALPPAKVALRPTPEIPKPSATPVSPAEAALPAAGGAADELAPTVAGLPKMAGSINLNRIQADDDVKSFINFQAQQLEDEIEVAKRGTMSEARVRELAARTGLTYEQLLKTPRGTVFNVEKGLAASQLNIAAATEAWNAAKAVQAGTGTMQAAKEAIARSAMIHQVEQGLAAETGRALGARRFARAAVTPAERTIQEIMAKLPEGVTDEIVQRLALMDPQDIAGITRLIRDSRRAKKRQLVYLTWLSGMLSGPATHIANLVSAPALAGMKATQSAVSGVMGAGLRAVGAPADRYIGEAGQQLMVGWDGIKDGFRAGLNVLKTGLNAAEQSKLDLRNREQLRGQLGRLGGRNIITGERKLFQRAVEGEGGLDIGRWAEFPLTALAAADEAVKATARAGALRQLAYRKAKSEGLSGAARRRRMDEIRANPTTLSPADLAFIEKHAKELTFTSDADRITQKFLNLRESWLGFKFIAPFVSTLVNIAKTGYRWSPLGAAHTAGRAIFGRIPLTDEGLDEASRALIAATTTLGVAQLVAEGHITGGGPRDPAQRAAKYQTGWRPYSFRIPEVLRPAFGGAAYQPYNRIEPLATVLGMTADMFEVFGVVKRGEQEQLAGKIFVAVANNMLNKTFVRGLSDAANALSDPERYGPAWAESFAGTLVPNIVASTARASDPVLRETRRGFYGLYDTIRARLPHASTDLQPHLNAWGEEIERPGGEGALGFLNRLINPSPASPEKGDATDREVARLGVGIGDPAKTFSVRGQARELSTDEYHAYHQTSGRLAKEFVDKLLQTTNYQRVDDDRKRRLIKQRVDLARNITRARMQRELAESSPP